MESLLLEQHLRSPLRLFPDPIMAQLANQANVGDEGMLKIIVILGLGP